MKQLRPITLPLLALLASLLAGCGGEEITVYEVPKEDHNEGRETLPAVAGMPSAGQLPPGMTPPPPTDPADLDLAWTAPDAWEEQPPSAFRLASYSIPNPDGQPGDVSISKLAGAGGGMLGNINRWRGQIGLPPVSQTELDRLLATVPTASGLSVAYIEMINGNTAIFAGILPSEGSTWFFKLTGATDHLVDNREGFGNLLASLAPRETTERGRLATASASPARVATQRNAEAPSLPWTTPEGWQPKQTSGMRVASFSVPGGDGETADVSVIPLGEAAGDLLPNVNRWRGQIGLDPVDAVGMESTLTKQNVGGHGFTYVDLRNPDNGQAILAAIHKHGRFVWFFKMQGPADVIDDQRNHFDAFVASFRFPPG